MQERLVSLRELGEIAFRFCKDRRLRKNYKCEIWLGEKTCIISNSWELEFTPEHSNVGCLVIHSGIIRWWSDSRSNPSPKEGDSVSLRVFNTHPNSFTVLGTVTHTEPWTAFEIKLSSGDGHILLKEVRINLILSSVKFGK